MFDFLMIKPFFKQAGSGRFFIMRAVGEDEEESLPVKYLQQR